MSTHVRLIAPSGYPHDHGAMARGVQRLRDAGCAVSGVEVLGRTEQRYAGSDAERAGDLNALAGPAELPDIVLAIRGGYGATRLLERLDYSVLRERLRGTSTLLVGYSADVEVVLERKDNVLRIPTQAIRQNNKIWLVDANNRLTEQQLETGLSNWSFTEIRSGLKAGDQVLISFDQDNIKAGVAVQPKSQ